MRSPGESGGKQHAQNGLAGDRCENDPHARSIFGGRQRIDQDVQRQQHKTQANRHPAEIARGRASAEIEREQSCEEQERSQCRNVERKRLND